MKKEYIRDYTVAMFRYYAMHGKPSADEILKLKKELSAAAILDLEAVDNTLRSLDSESKKAVEEVYFVNPERKYRRNEIEQRVIKFSIAHHIDRSNTYRKLKEARRICAQKRNLNLSVYW